MQTTIYQNKDFILIRKPHGVPSTFGKEESFLDSIPKHITEKIFTWTPLSELVPEDIYPFVVSHLQDFSPNADPETTLSHQVDTFGQDQEFGLLNRLDNETAGFLYFAKTVKSFDHFKSLQQSDKVKKHYLLQIEGRINFPTPPTESSVVQTSKISNDITGNKKNGNNMQHATCNLQQSSIFHSPSSITISFPIMHHRTLADKMVAISNPKDVHLGRSKQHEVSTQIDILHYDVQSNVSTILATITRGIRHQIRVHLASNGTAILGDSLYGKKGSYLHLRSLGFELEK